MAMFKKLIALLGRQSESADLKKEKYINHVLFL